MSNFSYNNVVGTFTVNAVDSPTTISFTGTLYRCIPHGSDTPLSSTFALNTGGRWNSAGSFAVLYTFASVQVARSFVDSKAEYGFSWDEIPSEQQLDLVVLNCSSTFADVATDSGLLDYGLPASYPIGYQTVGAYPVTQAIGPTIYSQHHAGLVTRSATASSWDGPMTQWAEVAVFPDHAPPPVLVDRFTFAEWYACE